jgi:hypothetical protein
MYIPTLCEAQRVHSSELCHVKQKCVELQPLAQFSWCDNQLFADIDLVFLKMSTNPKLINELKNYKTNGDKKYTYIITSDRSKLEYYILNYHNLNPLTCALPLIIYDLMTVCLSPGSVTSA